VICYLTVLFSVLVSVYADQKTLVQLNDIPETPAPPGTAQLWSAMNTDLVDHVYSTNKSEIQYLIDFYGFSVEGPKGTTTGLIHCHPQPDTVPLFRLYAIVLTDHLYTASVQERNLAIKRLGYHLEEIVGYVHPSPGPGRVPLYRLYNAPAHDHYYTSSEHEREDAARNGWAEEGVVGFILEAH